MGTPLIMILDHLTLARGGGMEVGEVSLNLVERMAPICGAASWRDEGVAAGPPVTTRLPEAVHLTAASCTWGGEMLRSGGLKVRLAQVDCVGEFKGKGSGRVFGNDQR